MSVYFYLNNGVKEVANGEKLKRKHIRLNFGEEFLDWWDNYIKENLGKWEPFRNMYSNFLLQNDLEKKDFSQKRFRKGIDESAERFDNRVHQRRSGTEKVMEIMIDWVKNDEKGRQDTI